MKRFTCLLDSRYGAASYFGFVCAGLVITALTKFYSSFGRVPILDQIDAVTGLKNEFLLRSTAVVEIVVALYLSVSRSLPRKAAVSLSLFLGFVSYRSVWFFSGGGLLNCPCLGFTTDALPIPRAVIQWILTLYVAAGLAGALALMFQHREEAIADTEGPLPSAIGDAKPKPQSFDIDKRRELNRCKFELP